jgi:3-carboxy-cis,cis-muconate cycloisomerase
MQGAAMPRQQRDGAAWFTEWLALPQLCILTGRALTLAQDLTQRLAPQPQAMARGLAADGNLIHAEALTFALAQRMPRPEAAAEVKALAAEVRDTNGDLLALAQARWQDLTLTPDLGTAPAEARAFAAATQQGGPT